MYEKVLNKYAVKQVGYVVDDLEDACVKMAETVGAGPFVSMLDYSPAKAECKGRPVDIVLDQAYGAYGDVQIEVIAKPTKGDEAIFDRTGFHHFAIWVDDVDEAVEEFKKAGFDVALQMESQNGLRIFFIDCRDVLGHYIELYNPQEGLFNMNQQLAENWDGQKAYMTMAEARS